MRLIQAKASLKELLSVTDLGVLLSYNEPREWAIAATQKNTNSDRFLTSLDIIQWDVDESVKYLRGALMRRSLEVGAFRKIQGAQSPAERRDTRCRPLPARTLQGGCLRFRARYRTVVVCIPHSTGCLVTFNLPLYIAV